MNPPFSSRARLASLLLALLSLTSACLAQPSDKPVDATLPVEKQDKGVFQKRHESFLARAKSGPIGLLFLGDSITDHWNNVPWIWDHFYGKYTPANFGVAGDTTGNVIWRIEHGELDGIHPKVVVLLVGTNNTASNTGPEVAAADTLIIRMIQAKIPETKILLLGIFPRGPRKLKDGSIDDGSAKMAVISQANEILSHLDNGDTIRYLYFGDRFLGQDGKIPDCLMADHLHPTAAGYEIWAEAMGPLLASMMQAGPVAK